MTSLNPRIVATKKRVNSVKKNPTCENPVPIFKKRKIPSYCKMPLENIKYILGPCSFYQFNVNGKNIYMFGETHGNISRNKPHSGMTKDNTIMFADFVHSLVTENPEKTYDLMFEQDRELIFDSDYAKHYRNIILRSHYEPEGKNYGDNAGSKAMEYMARTFNDCSTESLRHLCQYKNLRVHNLDYRDSHIFNEFNKTTDIYLTSGVSKVQEFLFSILNHPRIQKQIKQIKNKKLQSKLIQFFEDSILRLSSLDHDNIIEVIVSDVMIMDMYAIPRILRDFEPVKKNDAFSGTAENIIYYAGNFHIQTLLNFLIAYANITPIQPKIECKKETGKSNWKKRLMTHFRHSSEPKSFINLDVSKTAFMGVVQQTSKEDEAMLKLMNKLDDLFG
jgi:hypothetical protein